jgi:hypothetical protein
MKYEESGKKMVIIITGESTKGKKITGDLRRDCKTITKRQ